MAYRDEIDHSQSDPYGGRQAQPAPRRGVLGGLAVAAGILLVLVVALSFVGGAPESNVPAGAAPQESAPATTGTAPAE